MGGGAGESFEEEITRVQAVWVHNEQGGVWRSKELPVVGRELGWQGKGYTMKNSLHTLQIWHFILCVIWDVQKDFKERIRFALERSPWQHVGKWNGGGNGSSDPFQESDLVMTTEATGIERNVSDSFMEVAASLSV